MELCEFLVMEKIWYKVLQAINYRNNKIRDSWVTLFNECKFMGTSLGMSTEFSEKNVVKGKKGVTNWKFWNFTE